MRDDARDFNVPLAFGIAIAMMPACANPAYPRSDCSISDAPAETLFQRQPTRVESALAILWNRYGAQDDPRDDVAQHDLQ